MLVTVCAARCDPVVDLGRQPLEGPFVCWMIVAIYGCCSLILQGNLQQLSHVLLDGLWVRSSELPLQLCATSLLDFGHPTLPSQLAVGKIDNKIRVFLNGEVVVEGEVLAELKGLEPIDDDLVNRRTALHHLLVEEKAMAAETGYVTVDGFLGHFQVFGNLSVGHATDSFHDDLCV